MALQRAKHLLVLLLCFTTALHAQTIYYPAKCSDVIKYTAEDIAGLFSRATGSPFNAQPFTTLPQSGVILQYNPSVSVDQSCKIESDGKSILKFSALDDNGLVYGVYNYLSLIGFRFYLPGNIWEKIPKIISPYRIINITIAGNLKYCGWFISGGHNKWAMDNDDAFDWSGYFGKNGHEWALYQRRNYMGGMYRFSGHRGDIFTQSYVDKLQAHPCYTACFDGKREITSQSVPDIYSPEAKALRSSTIEQLYTTFKSYIYSNPDLYKNYYYNFRSASQLIGIEVPDGAKWGNSKDNSGCSEGGFNGEPYPPASDQQFILANSTAEEINKKLPDQQFQCYAYSLHANVPSSSITINKNIDVQVIPGAFQNFTSAKSLMNRWYKKYSNVSEYHYLNIPQWTGETPLFSLEDFRNTLQRIQQNKAQGILFEASPAKFASLPFFYAGNRFLRTNTNIDSTINDLVNEMFPPKMAVHVRQLLKYFGDEAITINGKYSLPLYLQTMQKAIAEAPNAEPEVKARLQELKAYLHYMVLYYDFASDKRMLESKADKAAALCLYLAKINKLQLVNSYYLILDLVRKYGTTSEFYKQYNVMDGKAYLKGKLPLITDAEINDNFSSDVAKYGGTIEGYNYQNVANIIALMKSKNVKPLEKINVKIGYDNSYSYSNRSEFYFYAASAGSINVSFVPHFGMKGGFINFTVEADDKPMQVLKDETITDKPNISNINVAVPSQGIYKLTIVSQLKASAAVTITTNGNTFYKKGHFYGTVVENYSDSNWVSLPKYFYVPEITELYFNIDNACYTGSCLTPQGVSDAFEIKNSTGKMILPGYSLVDAGLYKIAVDAENRGSFWQVSKMREYNLSFANISNLVFFAGKTPEAAPLPFPQTGVAVYPNPSAGTFNFKKNNIPVFFERLYVYDSHGKLLISTAAASQINLSHLPPGLYYFSGTKEAELMKGKLLKN